MTIKKLAFCILCSVNAANLATDEDLNDKNSSDSGVEEDILINKNSLNTRKWGDIYILFPHLSYGNIYGKIICGESCRGKLKNTLGRIFNFIASAVVEYKYRFHKYCGINVRLNLNNLEVYLNDKVLNNNDFSFFSFEPSLEWIYGRKGKHIFSGSFSPLGWAIMQKEEGSRADAFIRNVWTLGGILLKYEYDRRVYLNFGKVKTKWYSLKGIRGEDFWCYIVANSLSIEFGLNIIVVNDWRKKRKIENIEI